MIEASHKINLQRHFVPLQSYFGNPSHFIIIFGTVLMSLVARCMSGIMISWITIVDDIQGDPKNMYQFCKPYNFGLELFLDMFEKNGQPPRGVCRKTQSYLLRKKIGG